MVDSYMSALWPNSKITSHDAEQNELVAYNYLQIIAQQRKSTNDVQCTVQCRSSICITIKYIQFVYVFQFKWNARASKDKRKTKIWTELNKEGVHGQLLYAVSQTLIRQPMWGLMCCRVPCSLHTPYTSYRTYTTYPIHMYVYIYKYTNLNDGEIPQRQCRRRLCHHRNEQDENEPKTTKKRCEFYLFFFSLKFMFD